MRKAPPSFIPIAFAIAILSVVLSWGSAVAQTDPRVDLAPGGADAEQAIWNLRLLSNTPKPAPFDSATKVPGG